MAQKKTKRKKPQVMPRTLKLADVSNPATMTGAQPPLGQGAPEAPKKVQVVHTLEIGTTGSRNYSGYPSEEYLDDLRGYRRAEIFEQVRRSDSTISMLMKAAKNIIRGANKEVHQGGEGDDYKKQQEFIEHVFMHDMDESFDQYITEALTCLDFGHSVFEYTHKLVQNHAVFGSYVGLKNLGWRSPRTIDRWNLNPQSGKLASVTQISYGDLGRYVNIDAQWLIVNTMEREGSNYEGISLIRACYGSFIRKKTYLKLNAIGVEKFAIPTPTAQIPQLDLKSDQSRDFVESLENFVAHESQYLLFPVGWDVKLVSNTYDPQKVEYSVDAEDRRMVQAFCANFLSLGQGGSSGSYALSNDLSDFFTSGVDYIARLIVDDINRRLVPQLIQMNFGPMDKYPKIVLTGITDKAGKELSEIIKNFVDSKVIVADDELEENVRRRYKLPPASTEGQRLQQTPQQSPQASPLPLAENSLYHKIKLAESKRFKV